MVEEYVKCKHGEKQPTYLHPVMKEVLEETYGVMVYQEQVMRILNRLGGIELSQAYGAIKAISKKRAELIATSRLEFVAGAVDRGLSEARAREIFGLIEHFGGYGFNKSHSTAYALLLYQTAYLKAHFPTEFMAALLSSEMDGQEREKFFVEHIDDCRRMGITVLPPDVNRGKAAFHVESAGQVTFGLGAIKGVGSKAVDVIVEAREASGPFRGLDDFFERVSTRDVNQACAETLIRAGAFDSLGAKRAQLLAILPRAAQAGQAKQEDRKRGQRGLFDELDHAQDPSVTEAPLPSVPELPDAERLAGEKKALGFYMSSHPLSRHGTVLASFRTHQVSDLDELGDRVEVLLGGLVSSIQQKNVQKSRSGLTRMAKLQFEDLSGSIPAMLWPEDFAKNESQLLEDAIVFVRGTIDRRREPAELVISRVIPLDRAVSELAKGVVVTLHKGITREDQVERVVRIVRARPGGMEMFFEILGLSGVQRVIYRAGSNYRIRVDERLRPELEDAIGGGNVRFV
jgi:DNA polymerase-3 subunit alpha